MKLGTVAGGGGLLPPLDVHVPLQTLAGRHGRQRDTAREALERRRCSTTGQAVELVPRAVPPGHGGRACACRRRVAEREHARAREGEHDRGSCCCRSTADRTRLRRRSPESTCDPRDPVLTVHVATPLPLVTAEQVVAPSPRGERPAGDRRRPVLEAAFPAACGRAEQHGRTGVGGGGLLLRDRECAAPRRGRGHGVAAVGERGREGVRPRRLARGERATRDPGAVGRARCTPRSRSA